MCGIAGFITKADTNSLGHNDVTDGSRVTFSVGLATIKAAKAANNPPTGQDMITGRLNPPK